MFNLDNVKKNVKESFVISILLIVFALMLFSNADNFIDIAVEVLGYFGIFFGVISIFRYIKISKEEKNNSLALKNGIVFFFFGIIAIIKADILKEMVSILLGGYFILKHSSRVQLSFFLKEENSNVFKIILSISLFILVYSMIFILKPYPNISKNLWIALSVIICEVLSVIENIVILLGVKKK